jgi:hypothetical protein
MRDVQLEATSGLESDTIEGVIVENDYRSGTADMHFTSAYVQYIKRWVPILISIILCRQPGWSAKKGAGLITQESIKKVTSRRTKTKSLYTL